MRVSANGKSFSRRRRSLSMPPPSRFGARCSMAQNWLSSPSAYLRSACWDVIAEQRISTMWLTSSLFNWVVDEDPGILSPVSQILTGGEALSVTHIRKALSLLPSTTLINGYGPTETTTFAACYRIPRVLSAGATSIPIGWPISNTTAYVLDARGELVPAGVPGELYIGGPGVARGYLGSPN